MAAKSNRLLLEQIRNHSLFQKQARSHSVAGDTPVPYQQAKSADEEGKPVPPPKPNLAGKHLSCAITSSSGSLPSPRVDAAKSTSPHTERKLPPAVPKKPCSSDSPRRALRRPSGTPSEAFSEVSSSSSSVSPTDADIRVITDQCNNTPIATYKGVYKSTPPVVPQKPVPAHQPTTPPRPPPVSSKPRVSSVRSPSGRTPGSESKSRTFSYGSAAAESARKRSATVPNATPVSGVSSPNLCGQPDCLSPLAKSPVLLSLSSPCGGSFTHPQTAPKPRIPRSVAAEKVTGCGSPVQLSDHYSKSSEVGLERSSSVHTAPPRPPLRPERPRVLPLASTSNRSYSPARNGSPKIEQEKVLLNFASNVEEDRRPAVIARSASVDHIYEEVGSPLSFKKKNNVSLSSSSTRITLKSSSGQSARDIHSPTTASVSRTASHGCLVASMSVSPPTTSILRSPTHGAEVTLSPASVNDLSKKFGATINTRSLSPAHPALPIVDSSKTAVGTPVAVSTPKKWVGSTVVGSSTNNRSSSESTSGSDTGHSMFVKRQQAARESNATSSPSPPNHCGLSIAAGDSAVVAQEDSAVRSSPGQIDGVHEVDKSASVKPFLRSTPRVSQTSGSSAAVDEDLGSSVPSSSIRQSNPSTAESWTGSDMGSEEYMGIPDMDDAEVRQKRHLYEDDNERVYDEVPSELSPMTPQTPTSGGPIYEECGFGSSSSEGGSQPSTPGLGPRRITRSLLGREGAVRASKAGSGGPMDGGDDSDVFSEHFEESLRAISESCSEGADECDDEDRKKKKTNTAFRVVKELLETEEKFVKQLQFLNQTFRNFIMDAKLETGGGEIIPPAVLQRILQHLPALESLNSLILQDVGKRVENWNDNPRVADVFVKKGPFLKLYSSYMKDYDETMKSFEESLVKYPVFKKKVAEFETKPECMMLKLPHIMLEPIQRIPRYKLLFQAYQKALTPDSADYQDTIEAIAIVSEVAEHLNNMMKLDDKMMKMVELQNQLVGKEFSVLKPGREMLRKGALQKHSRKDLHPRTILLFNDCLLIAEPTPNGHLKVKYELSLLTVKVEHLKSHEKEFTISGQQRSMNMSAKDKSERDSWVRDIDAAVKTYRQRAQTFGDKNAQDAPEELGETAPVWVPDKRVTMCAMCYVNFSVILRRHHCRACGNIVCGKCSDYKAPLNYMKDSGKAEVQRVCKKCYNKLYEKLVRNEKLSLSERSSNKRNFEQSDHKTTTAVKHPPVKNARQEVPANDPDAAISGFLFTWDKKRWKQMWFLIKNSVMYSYHGCEDAGAHVTCPLLGYEVTSNTEPFEGVPAELIFTIKHKTSGNVAPQILRAETVELANSWIVEIEVGTKMG